VSSAINTSHLRTGSLWKAPYLWLSIAAIAELFVALLLLLNLALMLYHNYLWSLPAPPGTIKLAMDVPSVSQTIFYYSPFLASAFACIAGATFLFLRSKMGLYSSLGGLLISSPLIISSFSYLFQLMRGANLDLYAMQESTTLFSILIALTALVRGWSKVKWG